MRTSYEDGSAAADASLGKLSDDLRKRLTEFHDRLTSAEEASDQILIQYHSLRADMEAEGHNPKDYIRAKALGKVEKQFTRYRRVLPFLNRLATSAWKLKLDEVVANFGASVVTSVRFFDSLEWFCEQASASSISKEEALQSIASAVKGRINGETRRRGLARSKDIVPGDVLNAMGKYRLELNRPGPQSRAPAGFPPSPVSDASIEEMAELDRQDALQVREDPGGLRVEASVEANAEVNAKANSEAQAEMKTMRADSAGVDPQETVDPHETVNVKSTGTEHEEEEEDADAGVDVEEASDMDLDDDEETDESAQSMHFVTTRKRPHKTTEAQSTELRPKRRKLYNVVKDTTLSPILERSFADGASVSPASSIECARRGEDTPLPDIPFSPPAAVSHLVPSLSTDDPYILADPLVAAVAPGFLSFAPRQSEERPVRDADVASPPDADADVFAASHPADDDNDSDQGDEYHLPPSESESFAAFQLLEDGISVCSSDERYDLSPSRIARDDIPSPPPLHVSSPERERPINHAADETVKVLTVVTDTSMFDHVKDSASDRQTPVPPSIDLSHFDETRWLNDDCIYFAISYVILAHQRIIVVGGSETVKDWGAWATDSSPYRISHRTTQIIVPMMRQDHWTLFVLDKRRHTVDHFNSMPRLFNKDVPEICRALLRRTFATDGDTTRWKLRPRQSPRQYNTSDCGVFVILTAMYTTAGLPVPSDYNATLWRQLLPCLLRPGEDTLARAEAAIYPPDLPALQAAVNLVAVLLLRHSQFQLSIPAELTEMQTRLSAFETSLQIFSSVADTASAVHNATIKSMQASITDVVASAREMEKTYQTGEATIQGLTVWAGVIQNQVVRLGDSETQDRATEAGAVYL